MSSNAPLSPSRDLASEASDVVPADTFSNVASLSSTPPTTIADDASLTSDTPKNEIATSIGIADTPPSDPVIQQSPVADSIVITTVTTEIISAAAPALDDSPPVTRPNTSDGAPAPAPAPITPASTRPRRSRLSAPVYNIAKLAGTAVHGKRRSKGDDVADRKRRAVHHVGTTQPQEGNTGSLVQNGATPVKDTIHASDAQSPSRRRTMSPKGKLAKKQQELVGRRIATRNSGIKAETLATKLSSLGKRARKSFEQSVGTMSRELRRLQDTNEFSKIETKKVIYTTWRNGKYVDPDAEPDPEPEERPAKKAKVQDSSAYDIPDLEEEAAKEPPAPRKREVKKWLSRGLYAGQEAPTDIFQGLTTSEKKKVAELSELSSGLSSGWKPNKALPAPMFAGLHTLIEGRDFKLPFDVCNPLPPGQPKPAEWKKMTKNRFVGDAAAYWKKTPHFKDYQSKCVCTPEDGCGESCQNRIMLYECDTNNCNAGDAHCQNRAFARLTERVKIGGKFRVGVEVVKTQDRGFGIRASRPFKANQIIMEYTGEIITEEECDRRMNEKYKDNECYYLMSFDQNMIIDATTGSSARFVNHSCQPNCRMVKWIVSGQPRMALFAGDDDIMTGEELTYDYNFDPFSAKNVQKCLCGAPNCRGVLGPKPKEVKQPKPAKEELAKVVKKTVKVGKRKLKEVLGDLEDAEASPSKKRKIKAPTSVKAKTVKRTTLKTAGKGAATLIRRKVTSISVKSKGAAGKKNETTAKKVTTSLKTKTAKAMMKTYTKNKSLVKKAPPNKVVKAPRATPKKITKAKATARKTSLSIVANAVEKAQAKENTPLEAKTPSKSESGTDNATPSSSTPQTTVRPKIKVVNFTSPKS